MSVLLFPKLDEQMPRLPPLSSEAVSALVRELRVQLGMALFGVDVIINIHTHTLTVIDINVFPGTASEHVTCTHKLCDIQLHSSTRQVMRECQSFSPLCSATLSRCWTNGPQPAPRTLTLLSQCRLQVAFKSHQEQKTNCTVVHQLGTS